MAEAEVELLTQDASVSAAKGMALREPSTLRDDSYFLDGPVCRRVAVVDFDPIDGRPGPAPAPFLPDAVTPVNGTENDLIRNSERSIEGCVLFSS